MIADIQIHDGSTLKDCEAVIERGMQTVFEVGAALKQIRDNTLYDKKYGQGATFETYCKDRWGFTRMRASQLIAAREVVENVNQGLQIAPATERQVRPLSKLDDPGQQAEAWAHAVEDAGGEQPTAKQVAAAVKAITVEATEEEPDEDAEITAEPETVDESEPETTDSEPLFQMKRWWKRAGKRDRGRFQKWVESGGKL